MLINEAMEYIPKDPMGRFWHGTTRTGRFFWVQQLSLHVGILTQITARLHVLVGLD